MLARTLRRAELAGQDPRQTLADAVTDGSLTGAKNVTHVLSARITDGCTGRFDPVGATYAEWAPRTDNPEWNDYLAALATAADQRAGRPQNASRRNAWAAVSVTRNAVANATQRDAPDGRSTERADPAPTTNAPTATAR